MSQAPQTLKAPTSLSHSLSLKQSDLQGIEDPPREQWQIDSSAGDDGKCRRASSCGGLKRGESTNSSLQITLRINAIESERRKKGWFGGFWGGRLIAAVRVNLVNSWVL